jgi:adenylate kinase
MASNRLYIVLMGVQGSGKGTQATRLVEKYNIPHVSTGDAFRAMRKLDTPFARDVVAKMDLGHLISDEITLKVVQDRLSQDDAAGGAILDGFPRTKPQADGLDNLLNGFDGSKVNVVLFLNLDKESAIKRITDRWFCSLDAKHLDGYNLTSKPPQVAGHCDICNAPLKQRDDDTPEAAEKRINDFFSQTTPLLDYYRQRGVLVEIDGAQPIADVTTALYAAVDKADR